MILNLNFPDVTAVLPVGEERARVVKSQEAIVWLQRLSDRQLRLLADDAALFDEWSRRVIRRPKHG